MSELEKDINFIKNPANFSEKYLNYLRDIFSDPVRINEKSNDNKEETPFIKLVRTNNDDLNKGVIDIFLKYGSDIDAVDSIGFNALMHAVENNQQTVAKYLIECGTCFSDTVSHDLPGIAASTGDNEFTAYIIAQGTEGYTLVEEGYYIPLFSRAGGMVETEYVTIKKSLVDKYRKMGIHQAVIKSVSDGNYLIRDKHYFMYHPARIFDGKLSTGWIEEQQDDGGLSIDDFHYKIITLIMEEKISEYQYLLNERTDPDFNYKGMTFLHAYAHSGNIPKMTYYIEKNLFINTKEQDGKTPLFYALLNDMFDAAKYLISHKADMNVSDNENQWPLFIATRKQNLDMVKFMIDNSADSTIRDFGENSLLGVAADIGNIGLVQYFHDIGLDINYKNKSGDSVVILAINYGGWPTDNYKAVIHYLIKNGCDYIM